MNYAKIYEQLVRRARERVPNGYVERHHIIPKCMGGSDDNDNLVAFYPEEHFLAHVLLVKLYPDQQGLIKAVNKMLQMNPGRKRSRLKGRKLYGWLKRRFSEEMKRSQTGKGNTQFGTMWISNVELQENKKISKDDPIPEGWVKGRNRWSERYQPRSEKKRKSRPKSLIEICRGDESRWVPANYVSTYSKLGWHGLEM